MSKYYAQLTQEALLPASGPDALTFLQGQVTCDTRRVDGEHAIPGAYCTPQGRTVCDFLLCQLGEEKYAMRLRRDLREQSAAVFGKYIIFSKAKLDPEDEQWQLFGCWGEEVKQQLREIFGNIPDGQYMSAGGDGFLLVQVDEAGKRFECYLDASRLAAGADPFGDSLQMREENAWQALEIEAGIARLQGATSGEFVPQMLNFDLTGHISFDKGCYTGQEVVARLHYRGTPKRRLYRVLLPEHVTAAPGAPIYGESEGQSIGNLVNVSVSASGATQALAVVTVSKIEENLHLESPGGPSLALATLPYSLASE